MPSPHLWHLGYVDSLHTKLIESVDRCPVNNFHQKHILAKLLKFIKKGSDYCEPSEMISISYHDHL